MMKMTLIGMYEYDADLFSGITFPDGIDMEIFISTLLLEHGEKPVLYSSVEFMKQAVKMWSDKWYDSIKRIYAALTEEYDPLHNFDRHEEYTDNEKRDLTGNSTENTSGTVKGTDSRNVTNTTDSRTSTDGSTDTTTENTVSAYNETTYQPDNKSMTGTNTEGSSTDHQSGTETQSGSTENTETGSSTGTNSENENRDLTHSGHLYGNIGVTKSQEMLTDEINVRTKYNLYDTIADMFSAELLIQIY